MTRYTLITLLLLVGCKATPPQPVIEYRTISVSVPVPCKVTIPHPPIWMTTYLRKEQSAEVKIRTVLAENDQRKGYIEELLKAARACQ